MQTIKLSERTGGDGVLEVRIPLGTPNADFEITVVVQEKNSTQSAHAQNPTVKDYIATTYGSIQDETFCESPKLDLPAPPVF